MGWNWKYIGFRVFVHYPLSLLPAAALAAFETEPYAGPATMVPGLAALCLLMAVAGLPVFVVQELALSRRSVHAYALTGAIGLAWAPTLMFLISALSNRAVHDLRELSAIAIMAALMGAFSGALFWRLGVAGNAGGRAAAEDVSAAPGKRAMVRLFVDHPLAMLPAAVLVFLWLNFTYAWDDEGVSRATFWDLAFLAALAAVLGLPGHAVLALRFPRRSLAFYMGVSAAGLLVAAIAIFVIATGLGDGGVNAGNIVRALREQGLGGVSKMVALPVACGALSGAAFWWLGQARGRNRQTLWKQGPRVPALDVLYALLLSSGVVAALWAVFLVMAQFF